MPRWPLALLLLVPLVGCAADNGPDLDAYDGPYYDDGGTHTADRADFNYAYEQRALYGRTYYYPAPYYGGGYFYGGGYGGRYYRRADRDDAPRRDRDTAARGESGRDRIRAESRSPVTPPRRTGGDLTDRNDRTHVIPNRPSESALRSPDRPSRSPGNAGGSRGSPRGGGGRR